MKKKLLALSVVVAVLAIAAAGTLAYFTADETAHNVITTGGVDIELLETAVNEDGATVPFEDVANVVPDTEVSKIVEVKNTGESAAWIRVSVEKAIELAQAPEDAEADLSLVTMDFNEEDWTYEDGYYYYNAELKPSAETEPLFTAVSFAAEMGNMYQESTATVSVIAQATQVVNNGGSALEAAGWPAEKEA